MALQKTLVGTRGDITTYHRIARVNQVYDDGVIEVKVNHYADESYRNIEKDPETGYVSEFYLHSGIYLLPYTDDNFSREVMYERLKLEVEQFKDAEDC